jgi:lipopolysaccharide transport system permease protein
LIVQAHFALILFSGLIAFNVFAENLNAAPRLVLNHVSYIKKVVFPLEILPWVSLLSTLITALISTFLLFVFYTFLMGVPSITVLYVPVIVAPLCLTTLGVVWFVSSLGVFLRDLQHAVGICVTVLLFLSPIFYPLSAVPDSVRRIIMLNPITSVVEMLRGAIFFNSAPSLSMLGWAYLLSWCVASAGFWWFMRIKKGFADVV